MPDSKPEQCCNAPLKWSRPVGISYKITIANCSICLASYGHNLSSGMLYVGKPDKNPDVGYVFHHDGCGALVDSVIVSHYGTDGDFGGVASLGEVNPVAEEVYYCTKCETKPNANGKRVAVNTVVRGDTIDLTAAPVITDLPEREFR